MQSSLDPSQPTPSSDLTVTVTGSKPAQSIRVSNTATRSSYSIPVTIHAGTRISDTFYVQAGNSTGFGTLQYQGGPYPPITVSIPVVKSGLAILLPEDQSSPLPLSAGMIDYAAIVPILLPVGTPSALPLSTSGGLGPIPVAVSSSASQVATVSPQSVMLSGSGVSFSISGVAAGNSTISLGTTSTFDVSNSQAQLAVVVK